GNGSLMRILPLAFYTEKMSLAEQFELTHQVSSITHRHLRSQMACGLYVQMAINLLRGQSKKNAYEEMKNTVLEYYSRLPYNQELPNFARILESDISKLSEDSIKSGGYVVDTLEASIWAFLNNHSYKETVLAAVNLGGDTDTTGAVAGGLAGLYYGYESIPEKWIDRLARKDDIIKLAEKFFRKLSTN
ncbi:MAG: ADP-ribosylglycohydrolase family protein, partial [Candidatus Bathyarchaeia archaeon]